MLQLKIETSAPNNGVITSVNGKEPAKVMMRAKIYSPFLATFEMNGTIHNQGKNNRVVTDNTDGKKYLIGRKYAWQLTEV